MGKSIRELDISMQKRAQSAYDCMNADKSLKNLGVESVAISETKRDLLVQIAYYCKGRMEPADVKRVYARVGLYDPSEEECKQKVTWTLNSKHIEGKAIDFVPVKNGNYWWTAPDEVWERMGVIGEQCGLQWGGRWEGDQKDRPHFQM